MSDFGTLTTLGAGANWSPVERLNLIASWTREEGAPSVQQFGDPVLDTPGTRIFDFTTGETVLATVITGGNPDLDADRRNVWQARRQLAAARRQPTCGCAPNMSASRHRPAGRQSSPGRRAALEAAFPDRFVRDAGGNLVSADLRPVNFDSARARHASAGASTSPSRCKSARPSQAVIDQMRARLRAAGGAAARRRTAAATVRRASGGDGGVGAAAAAAASAAAAAAAAASAAGARAAG